MYSKTVALVIVSFFTVALLFGSYSHADVFARSSSSSKDKSGGGGSSKSGSSNNSGGGQGTTSGSESSNGGGSGGNSGGGGGSGSVGSSSGNTASSTPQTTCPDDLILNADGKCVPKNQSTTPMQTGNGATTTSAGSNTGTGSCNHPGGTETDIFGQLLPPCSSSAQQSQQPQTGLTNLAPSSQQQPQTSGANSNPSVVNNNNPSSPITNNNNQPLTSVQGTSSGKNQQGITSLAPPGTTSSGIGPGDNQNQPPNQKPQTGLTSLAGGLVFVPHSSTSSGTQTGPGDQNQQGDSSSPTPSSSQSNSIAPERTISSIAPDGTVRTDTYKAGKLTLITFKSFDLFGTTMNVLAPFKFNALYPFDDPPWAGNTTYKHVVMLDPYSPDYNPGHPSDVTVITDTYEAGKLTKTTTTDEQTKITTTDKDGHWYMTFPMKPDGSVSTYYENGTTITKYPDGHSAKH